MSGPRVSVVMAVFNGERFLRPAIDSILAQTFADFEFIIVDDGSTDATPAVLASHDNPRLRIFRNERNLGLTRSLNLAVAEAHGEYVARMDADDMSQPERLARQADFLDAHPAVGLVGTAYEIIDESDRTLDFGDPPTENDELQGALLRRNRFCHGSVMMRRETLHAVGGYDESFARSQDYDLWLRLAEHTRIANLREYLYLWRQHGGRISTLHVDEQDEQAARARQCALRRRACSLHLGKQDALLAWAQAAFHDRRPAALVALLAKAALVRPCSPAPWRLAFGRLAWTAGGILGIGRAAAIRNEKRVQREIGANEVVLQSQPSHLAFLMIDTCNAKCLACGTDAHGGIRRLKAATCARVLAHVRPRLLTTVMFGGAGEPLLNPEWETIVAFCRQRCPAANLVLITNGISMIDRVRRTLLREGVNVVVSINAATTETYRRVMQVEQFDRVCANVRALAHAARAAGAPLRIVLSLISSPRNVHELPALVRLAHELGVSDVVARRCPIADLEPRSEDDRFVVEARRLAAMLGVRFEHEPLLAAPPIPQRSTAPWRVLCVGFDGQALAAPGESAPAGAGNLAAQDIDDVWNNEFHVALRRQASAPAPRTCHALDWFAAYQHYETPP